MMQNNNTKKYNIRQVPFLFLFLFGVVCLGGALYYYFGSVSNPPDALSSASSGVMDHSGRILSENYCTGCHRYPEPALLPKRTWISQTLPNMGPFLGIREHNGIRYPVDTAPGLSEDFYPPEPLLSHPEWQAILDYYEATAPERLGRPEKQKDIVIDPLFFEAKAPAYRGRFPPLVTAIRFDTVHHRIYLSDAGESNFAVFDRHLELIQNHSLSTFLSDIQFLPDGDNIHKNRELLLTYLGSVNPSEIPEGSVRQAVLDPETGKLTGESVITDQLVRPAKSVLSDINEDGKPDLIVHEFGHRTGSVFWLQNKNGQFDPEKHLLIETPGCIQSHIKDLTGNGRPDITTLCTQTDQAIYLFENKGAGRFTRKTLIRFDITMGSSSFEIHDFNGDGYPDILYTSGDNADYSQVYKPYHGVYIFLNDGQNNFTRKWFYPVSGAYKARAADFDGDGRSDIAAISFFANYSSFPEEGFLLFLNDSNKNGELSFTPYHPPAASSGRWITMDVADWTGNGVEDILLANFSLGPTRVHPGVQNRFTQAPPFLLLENHRTEAGR